MSKILTESIAVLGGLGLGFGIFLAFFSKKFEVKENPKIQEILNVLPQINCGGCGYAGCAAYAEAVASNNDVAADLCIPGQREVAEKVSRLLGRNFEEKKVRVVAQLKCSGGKEEAAEKFEYEGIESCSAASLLHNGLKLCSYGCIGFGDCIRGCKFDALRMHNSLPVVDRERCVGCGGCVRRCPKKLFILAPKDRKIHVLCSSKDRAKDVVKGCKKGCIACRACERICPADAVHVKENLAEIDYSRCLQCGKCVDACPRNVIAKLSNS